MNRKGFIFDLDGVIVDTAKYHYLAWKNLANSIGIDFTSVQNEELKGVSRVKSLEKILTWGNKTLEDQEFNDLMSQKNEEYLKYINTMGTDEILPDVPKVLLHLIKNDQPIALGSASKNARTILEKVSLLNKFDAIVDGNDVKKAKPDPEVFLNAAEKLKIEAQNCVVFEDSVAGIQAANAANMISVGIGNKETLSEADYIFNDFTEMDIDFIDQLIKK